MVPERHTPGLVGHELTAPVWGSDDVERPTAICFSKLTCLPVSHILHPQVPVRTL